MHLKSPQRQRLSTNWTTRQRLLEFSAAGRETVDQDDEKTKQLEHLDGVTAARTPRVSRCVIAGHQGKTCKLETVGNPLLGLPGPGLLRSSHRD